MIVNAVPEADPPYALVEGIQSSRALSTFIRAVMHWYAFGRYDYLIVDLNGFGDWSSPAVDDLAEVADAAADAGHWLAFFPVATHWTRGAGERRLHAFPDRAHAQQAMQQHWSTQARSSVLRWPFALTPGSWRGTAPRRVPGAQSQPGRRLRWGRA